RRRRHHHRSPHPGGRGPGCPAHPDRARVRPAGVPRPAPARGLHPRAAPRQRLGFPGCRQLHGDRARPPPPPEARGRPRPPDPPQDGVGRGLPLRGLTVRRLVLLVASCALGAVAAALAGAAVDLPPRDALHLAWLAGGAGLVVGCAGGLGVHLLQRRSLAANLAWIAVVSAGAAAVGAIAAARAMFISAADLRALVVIVVAATAAGIVVALALGGRVAAGSRALAGAARRIGEGSGMPVLQDLPTGELALIGRELAVMTERLDQARARERALDASRRELVAWVSHDLRTPLSGIRAMTEALEDGVVDDPEAVRRYHRAIRVEADRLSGLVDDLFELSRISAGALRLRPEPVSLSEPVSDAI